MGNDRFDQKAARVEKILESGDLNKAMETLRSEVQGLSNEDRLKVFKSLEEQNKAANDKQWSLPNVTIDEKRSWLGFGDKTGEVEVNMSHNIAEKAVQSVTQAYEANPFNQIATALDKANKDK